MYSLVLPFLTDCVLVKKKCPNYAVCMKYFGRSNVNVHVVFWFCVQSLTISNLFVLAFNIDPPRVIYNHIFSGNTFEGMKVVR